MTKAAKNPLEWTVFALSLVLVLATLGFLALQMVRRGGAARHRGAAGRSAPDPERLSRAGRGHQRRPTTAEDVQIPIVLELADGEREEAELDLAFLPQNSRRNG